MSVHLVIVLPFLPEWHRKSGEERRGEQGEEESQHFSAVPLKRPHAKLGVGTGAENKSQGETKRTKFIYQSEMSKKVRDVSSFRVLLFFALFVTMFERSGIRSV